MNNNNEMLSVNDIASEIYFAPRTVRRWILNGRSIILRKRIYLKAEKKGNKYYIKRGALKTFLKISGNNDFRNF